MAQCSHCGYLRMLRQYSPMRNTLGKVDCHHCVAVILNSRRYTVFPVGPADECIPQYDARPRWPVTADVHSTKLWSVSNDHPRGTQNTQGLLNFPADNFFITPCKKSDPRKDRDHCLTAHDIQPHRH